MQELSVDPTLAPDLVRLFGTKLVETRQALDDLRAETRDLQDEIARLRQQKADMFLGDLSGVDNEVVGTQDKVVRELERTRLALAGSNREVLETAHANQLLEEEAATLRSEITVLRSKPETQPAGDAGEDENQRPSRLARKCPAKKEIQEFREQSEELSERANAAEQRESAPQERLQDLGANKHKHKKKFKNARKALSSNEELTVERQSSASKQNLDQSLSPSPLGENHLENEGQSDKRSNSKDKLPSREARFNLHDGPGPETLIPCMGYKRHPFNLPWNIRQLLHANKCMFVPEFTISPFNRRCGHARIVKPMFICDTSYTPYEWKRGDLYHLESLAGATIELFHRQCGGICYLGTYKCAATGSLPVGEYRQLSSKMKNDLVNETFACRNAVSESDYKHVSRMYRKGTRQVQYADFNYVAYNRELYDALKEQQKEDDGVGTSQTQPTKRKHDGQAGEWQARKRARV